MSEKIQQTNASAKTSPLPNFLLFQANNLHMFKKGLKKKKKKKVEFFPCEQNQAFGVLYVEGFKPSQEITLFWLQNETKNFLFFPSLPPACLQLKDHPGDRGNWGSSMHPSSLSLPPNAFLLLHKAERHPQPKLTDKRHL